MKKLLACLLACLLLAFAGCAKPAATAQSAEASSQPAAVSSQPAETGSASAQTSSGPASSEPAPAEPAAADGTVQIARPADKTLTGQTADVSLDAGAEPFLLWADGAVERVSLSRVAYQSDGTFTQTESLWSVDRLESGDGLLVTAVIPEGAPDLQLTWTGAGGTQTRLISESGKDGSLLLIDPASMAAEAAPQALDISNLMPFSCDLDGDGTEDEISILGVAYDKDNNMYFQLRVLHSGSVLLTAETKIGSAPAVWLADLNGDGNPEIYMSGDMASDDYVTYGWTLGKGLEPILFTGDTRPNTLAAENYADGFVTGTADGQLLLISATDMLGSYWGTRPYAYTDTGALAPAAGTLWTYVSNANWLTVKKALPVTLTDGTAASLPAGTSLRLTASDGVSMTQFETKDGQTGSITVTPNTASGGWLISGASENDYFDSLPYAD